MKEKFLQGWIWIKVLGNERGQGLIEYAVLLALILLVAIALIKGVGGKVNNTFSNVNSNLP